MYVMQMRDDIWEQRHSQEIIELSFAKIFGCQKQPIRVLMTLRPEACD